MTVISITRLRLRSWRFLPAFVLYAVPSNRQARKAPGNLGVQLMRQPGNAFWTASCWETEDAVRQYMISGTHGRAMRRLMHWCDEASMVRWTQDTTTLPDWREAHRRMIAEGRRSKVLHPSAAHERFEIPEPRS